MSDRNAILEEALRTARQLPWAAPLLSEIERGRNAGLEEAAGWHDEQRKMAHVLASKSPLHRLRFDRQAVHHNTSADAIRALKAAGASEGRQPEPSPANRIIAHKDHADLPGNWRARQIRYGSWSLDVELPCTNGLAAWFSVATFDAADDGERLATDGARQEAGEYAAKFAALATWMGGNVVRPVPSPASTPGTDIVRRIRAANATRESYLPWSDYEEAADEIERLHIRLGQLRSLSDMMAEDAGLWFFAQTAAEAYLQQELRKLCALIESVSIERRPEEVSQREALR